MTTANYENTDKIVCWGSGTIGSSWALNFALRGFSVTVYDLNAGLLRAAEKRIQEYLEPLTANGYLSAEAAAAAVERIVCTAVPEDALQGAAFIQESAPERLELKQSITVLLDSLAPADCIIASSTSGLRISDITAHSIHPERYIGAHPFNPPHLIPLVEITKQPCTAPEALQKALSIYRRAAKEPVVLNIEKPGFIANRFQHAVLREFIALVTEGVCSVADADRALTYGPGLRWAAIGQGMIGELASPDGAEAFNRVFRPASETIFRDLSNMTAIPDSWPELAGAGVEQEKAELPDTIGHTRQDISSFRDAVLLALLRLHGKL